MLPLLAAAFLASSCHQLTETDAKRPAIGAPPPGDALLRDGNGGEDWAAYGQSYGEQHFSPLEEINAANVGRLGLAWYYDLPPGNSISGPIEVGGVLYTATGYSVVRAFDVRTGHLLWTFDSNAAELAGHKLRMGWGIRGLAWSDGKIIVGTQDGRLVAVDARTGAQLWSALTVDKDDYRYISGAPRVFDGKVIIGHGGADNADIRGYVTAYDTATGKLLWRFFTVPGDPAKGFEDDTQAMAAKTWSGEWWKHGGGGTAWNSFTYDPDTKTIFVGTGNGAPWNHRIRSDGKGDNLFLCSIVALDADTGKYKWHYQVNPAESWDYNAAMDMQLADLTIGGRRRKVLIQAPKNGFLYVIDRITGELISADPIATVTWAKSIDLKTGRPDEDPRARYPNGSSFVMRPGPRGAHGWLPSAFSRQSGLVYLPVSDIPFRYSAKGVDEKNWVRAAGNVTDGGVFYLPEKDENGRDSSSYLLAWDPASRRAAWKVATPFGWNGGILATAGNLVVQGQAAGKFVAYSADKGKALWSFDAQAPVLAPPISYRVGGRQYITVLTGTGTTLSVLAEAGAPAFDYRTVARRVLTFALDGKASLPAVAPARVETVDDPSYRPDEASAGRGFQIFVSHCLLCHGPNGVSAGTAPNLQRSPVPTSSEAFESIVRGGALTSNGMPRFEEFTDQQISDLRQYVRAQSAAFREANR